MPADTPTPPGSARPSVWCMLGMHRRKWDPPKKIEVVEQAWFGAIRVGEPRNGTITIQEGACVRCGHTIRNRLRNGYDIE